MAKMKSVAAGMASVSTSEAKPASAGKAVGYSRDDAAPPAISGSDTSMGGYQDVSGREDQVRMIAYRLWEEADRPDGRNVEFWEQAERQIDAR